MDNAWVPGEISKITMTDKDVLVVSFKDVRLYNEFAKSPEFKTALAEMFRRAFGKDIGIVCLPPGIELGVIEKKEIAPWVAFTQMTGETGLEGKVQ